MGVNPDEEMGRAQAAAEAIAVNPLEGAVRANSEPRFKPKSTAGSLIPPKRRLVKQMMFECTVQAIASWFHPTTRPSFYSVLAMPKMDACKNKTKIFPVEDGANQFNSPTIT